MTNVRVDPGVCGFPTSVTVQRIDKERVKVTIESDCPQVVAMAEKLGGTIEWKRAFGELCDTTVYRAAAGTLRHATCPIPMAVLKAIEAEVGAALPKDVSVTFTHPDS